MTYRIQGILKLPDGAPAANCEIEFVSRKNFSPLVQGAKTNIMTSATGAYDVTLELGDYAVILYTGGTYPSQAGVISVLADTAAGQDLPTLLGRGEWQPATPDYIKQIEAWLVSANASAASAANSANSAASTLANALTKSGNLAGLTAPDTALNNLGLTTVGKAVAKAINAAAGRSALGALYQGNTADIPTLNALTISGIYSGRPGTSGIPSGAGGQGDHVMNLYWDANAGNQMYFQYDANKVFIRNKASGIFSGWSQVYHEGYKPNFSDVSSKPTTISGYGITDALQNVAATELDANAFTSTALFKLVGAGWANIPSGAYSGANRDQLLNAQWDADSGTQIYLPYSNNTALAWRRKSSGSYSAWMRLYHEGYKPTADDVGALASSGTAVAATKLATSRTLTIGNTGKAFDGTGNVAWSLAEMGVYSKTEMPYETGTFTPTVLGSVSAGATTYGIRLGNYTRIGNRVFFELYVTWTAATGTGELLIGGFPFVNAATSPGQFTVTPENLTFSGQIGAGMASSSSAASLMSIAPGAALSAVQMDSAAGIRMSGVYQKA